jgi:hypothetical protein
MSEWFVFGAGAFCGALLFDLMWRVLHGLTLKLVNEQRDFIDELLGRPHP